MLAPLLLDVLLLQEVEAFKDNWPLLELLRLFCALTDLLDREATDTLDKEVLDVLEVIEVLERELCVVRELGIAGKFGSSSWGMRPGELGRELAEGSRVALSKVVTEAVVAVEWRDASRDGWEELVELVDIW